MATPTAALAGAGIVSLRLVSSPLLRRQRDTGVQIRPSRHRRRRVYPLEFTARFGYPTITFKEGPVESPTGAFVHDLAHGDDPELRVHSGYQVCARVVLPPFPFEDPETYEENSRNPAVVFNTDDREGIHIEDAKRVEGQWRVAGENGMPLVVTGKGATMGGARAELSDRVDDVLLPNCYYRDDIGERWLRGEGDRLQSWGYLGPPTSSG